MSRPRPPVSRPARGEHVVPIPGSRRIERLEENAAAADIDLTTEELDQLDEILPAGVAAGMRYPEGGMRAVNV
jgi:aryl-alcohol dehydrogenase-like predicted oxidoreductase